MVRAAHEIVSVLIVTTNHAIEAARQTSITAARIRLQKMRSENVTVIVCGRFGPVLPLPPAFGVTTWWTCTQDGVFVHTQGILIGGRMQYEQFAQVKALFAEVCDLVEPARSERLHALSVDSLVIAEVQALLDQTVSDAARFAQPVLQALAHAAGDELKVGDRLGVWTLLGEIGHGGMGTVFRAQRNDGHFEQIAAIKVARACQEFCVWGIT
jgi:hypothetical protein